MGQLMSQQRREHEQNQSQSGVPAEDQVAWWCKLMAKTSGTVGGLVAMLMGLFSCLNVYYYPKSIVAGIWLLVFGFVVIAMEAPCFCLWLDFISKISRFSETRPHWQKAVAYVIFGIIPLIILPGIYTFFGGAMLLLTGLLYGTFALGKKADRETMMASAEAAATRVKATTGRPNDGMEVELVDEQKDPTVNYPA